MRLITELYTVLARWDFHSPEHDVGLLNIGRLAINCGSPTRIVSIGEDEIAGLWGIDIDDDLFGRVGNDGGRERRRDGETERRGPDSRRLFVS